MPVALMDVLAAHHLKEGILVSLLHRERTGEGSFVQVSLIKAAVSSLANQATGYLMANSIPGARVRASCENVAFPFMILILSCSCPRYQKDKEVSIRLFVPTGLSFKREMEDS
jgi:hypothetical protein